jgi:O-antigen/teichoic acid export membrane protein
MMNLEEFGYYAFAGVAVGVMQYLSSPIFATFFPSFARKATIGQEAELVSQYHQASQVMAVVLVPAGAILVCFAGPLLRLWTADPDLTARALPFTVLLGLGMTLHTLTTLPYSLQLAHGWTSLTVSSNAVLFMVLFLSIFLVAPHYGAAGVALVWAALNGAHLLVSVWLMHRRILIGEMTNWYLRDLLPPITAVVATGLLVRALVPEPTTRAGDFILVSSVYLSMSLIAFFAAPVTRKQALKLFFHLRY